MAAGAALVLIVCGVAGFRYAWPRVGPISAPDAEVLRGVADGQDVMLAVPPRATGDLVVWVHGRGGTQDEILTQRASIRLRDAVLERGFMLAGTEGHGLAWGNQQSVADVDRLVAWARSQRPVRKVVVIGQSMGGVSSVLAATSLPDVAGWVGIYPVCDVSSVSAAFGQEIAAAYGGPARGPVPFSRAWAGRPVLILASPADTVVPKRANADVCAHEARAAGAQVREVATAGDHGDWSNFQPGRIVGFLERAVA